MEGKGDIRVQHTVNQYSRSLKTDQNQIKIDVREEVGETKRLKIERNLARHCGGKFKKNQFPQIYSQNTAQSISEF